jgi:aryl-alcohol dehydrogenase-like predicted oxidoreductase
MKRRTFLKTVGGVTGGLALSAGQSIAADLADKPAPSTPGDGVPKRVLGRTGQQVSVVGFPGLALIQYDQARCTEGLRRAFDRGINYFDIAPAYGNGQCETRMGIGLQGLDRSRYFLACKTKMRDKDGARKELENSLRLLKTDHFDLYQMHHLVRVDDVKKALGPGGALETFLKAKEEGKVKSIGFSAHTTKAALEALRGFDFDTVMFPISFVEFFLRDFGKDVMALANAQGAAILAIKAMSRGTWPKDVERTRKWWYRSVEDDLEVSMAWRFVLSQKGVVAGFPPSYLDLVDKAIQAVQNFRPVTPGEMEELKRVAQTTGSIFVREEEQAEKTAAVGSRQGWAYHEHPHECDGHEV